MFHKFYTGYDWQPGSVETLAGDNPVAVAGTPSAVSWGANRLDVFYSGRQDFKAYHRYYDGGDWKPATSPESIGGDLGGPVLGKIAATTSGEGHIDLVALSPKRNYVTRYLDGDAWHPANWSSLGGSFAGEPATVRLGAQLRVFGVDKGNGTLLHKYWSGDQWVGWEDLGGGPFTGPLTATSWGADRFDVFAVAADGTLQHRYFQTDAYSSWESLGGGGLARVAPAVAVQRPGAFDIVVAKKAASGSGLTYLSKGFDGSRWYPDVEGWYESTTATFSGAPAAVSWSETTVAYFGVSADKLVFRYWYGTGWYPEDGTWASLADLKGTASGKWEALLAQELR